MNKKVRHLRHRLAGLLLATTLAGSVLGTLLPSSGCQSPMSTTRSDPSGATLLSPSSAPRPQPTETAVTIPAFAGRRTIRMPILAYHYVDFFPVAGAWGDKLTVKTAAFIAEMDYLARAGFHTVTLEDVYRALNGPGRLPAKPIAITFDDGGSDDYTVAFPVLRSHHFVATFFVPTAFVGTKGHATWSQLADMSRAGMAIESHTVRHHDLTTLSDGELLRELADSRAAIKQRLGFDSRILAYPGGRYDWRVIEAARAAGYVASVTVHAGSQISLRNAYEWPRIGIGPWDVPRLFRKAIIA